MSPPEPTPHRAAPWRAWTLALLLLTGCGLGGLESSLYDPPPAPPDASTPAAPLTRCVPNAVRCITSAWYERCDPTGEIVESDACGWDEVCAEGASPDAPACLPLEVRCGAGQALRLVPDRIAFKDVQTLKATRRTTLLTSCGPDTLIVESVEVLGRPAFNLDEPLDLPPEGLTLRPGVVLPVRVNYQPSPYTHSEEGELRVIGALQPQRGPRERVELRVPLSGRAPGVLPTPLLTPTPLDFGFVPIGQRQAREVVLRNRSDLPLYVEWVQEDRALDPRGALQADFPATFALDPQEELAVPVTFAPAEVGPAELRYRIWAKPWPLDAPWPEVILRGTGVEVSSCDLAPIPQWTVAPDTTLRPMQDVVLDAAPSYAQRPDAAVTAYQPALNQRPQGSTAALTPSPDGAPRWRSTLDLAGTYFFGLDVSDSAGLASCQPQVVRVDVAPRGDLHVELTWVTPGDRNPDDEGPGAGADLDLALAREPLSDDPSIPHEPWIQDPNRCAWDNPEPDWGTLRYGPDDCRVLRADNDGAGPEIITLEQSEGRRYTVLVDAQDDAGYGPSLARVQIYLRGELRYASTARRLEPGQRWEVALVTPWASLIEELDRVTPAP